ncbi:MAG TPA: hypothetical protein VFZ65_08620 [Planctomycetota bacterium]|nr:hypothetical protein [Planctomycetota bacterium]
MQPIRSLAAVAFVTATVSSQVNPFLFYPQDPVRQTVTCTSFVGRPDLSNAAEALMEINTDHMRGVGDANGLIRLFGVYHWIADERLSTVETYDLVVRNGAASGGPDMSPAAEFLRISGLTTPPSSNPMRGTWIAYDGFGIAGGLVITVNQPPYAPPRYYVGVDLPANPLWPTTDGHSLFRADLLNAGTGAVFGENHRLGAPDPTWAGLHGAPSFSTPWTYILGPFVTSPNLQIGGLDPTSNRLGAPGANLSMNGLFPDISGMPRSDGLTLRITDVIAPFGVVFLGGSMGFQPAYFEFSLSGTLIGHSHIGGANPSGPVPLGITTLMAGVREVSIAMPNTLSPSLMGQDFAFQAVVWDVNFDLAEWTNAQVTHL